MSSLFDSILVVGGYGMLAAAYKHLFAVRSLGATFVDRDVCDLTDPAQVESYFRQVSPTLVINCAAYTNVDKAEQEEPLANAINGQAVATLAKVCRQRGAMLVHYSTDFVFDGSLRRPLRPDDPVGPLSAYGRSKLLGERLLLEHAPADYLILRTAWLYGPRGPSFPQTMINAARSGKPLKVVSDQIGSPTFTRDLADATLNLIDAKARGLFHLTNSGQTNWFDFTHAILDEFNLKADLSPTTAADWKSLRPTSAIRPAYSVLDCSDYERATGKRLPDWRDALHRYRQAIEAESVVHPGP